MRRDDIRRLREQRAHTHEEMRTLVGKATEDNRDLTAEETQEYERLETEFRSLGDRATLAEKTWREEQDLQREMNAPIELRMDEDGSVPLSFGEYRKKKAGDKPWDTAEYRSAYFHYLSTTSTSDLDVEEHRVLSKASGAAGSYLVPTDMYDQIVRAIRFMGAIAEKATVVNTSTGDLLNVPANTAHGTASWTAESAGYAQTDETFAQIGLNAFKAATSIIISEELLTDSAFPLDSFLAREFGERIGVLENTAYINGSGTGQPQGILPNLTTVSTAPTGNATTFSYTALVTGVFALPAQYRQNASFVVADAAARNLYLMQDLQNRPLWSVNVASTGPDTFLGYPIYTDPDMPAPAANAKSMMFGDWQRVYVIRRVDGFSMQRQNELYSNNGQVGFRGFERVDGRVVLAAAGVAIQHSAT